jgi:hypothetical protein
MALHIQHPGPLHAVEHRDDARPVELGASRAADTAPLARIENLRHAIAEVRTLDEAKSLRDMSVSIEVYAKRAVLSRDIVLDAAEVRLLAEQAVGRKLRAMEKSEGGRPNKNPSCDTTGFRTLKDLGINGDQASKWQRIADLPKETLTRYFEKSRLRGQPVTTSGAVRLAMERVDRAKRRDARQTARTRGGAASYQAEDDAHDWDGRRLEPHLVSGDDHNVVAEDVSVSADELPYAGDEGDELVDLPGAAPRVEIVAGPPAQRPVRQAPSQGTIAIRVGRRQADHDDIASANTAVSAPDESLHEVSDRLSAPIETRNDHLTQFCALLQQARGVTTCLNHAELRVAAREAEELVADLAITLQVLREAEPACVADVDDGPAEWHYNQAGAEGESEAELDPVGSAKTDVNGFEAKVEYINAESASDAREEAP